MKFRRLVWSGCGWLCGISLGLVASGHGQSAGWLDFNGAIKGESVEKGHEDWITISGFVIDGAKPANLPGFFGLTKSLDRASPLLVDAVTRGTKYPTASLDFGYTDASPYFRVGLENVIILSDRVSSSGDRPLETISLGFEKITYTYIASPGGPISASVDYKSGFNPDSDADGLPDDWENTHGLSVGANDSGADPDGDGLTNLQEYQLGTDPQSGSSFFKATLVPVSGQPGVYQLSWNSVSGKAYVIEWSPDLKTPFVTILTVTATGSSAVQNVSRPGNIGFYRVRPQ